MEGEDTRPEMDDYTPESYDQYLAAKVMLPQGGELKCAHVTCCKRDADNQPIGTWYNNLILDSCLYKVEFPDGSSDTFSANMIAENLFSQVDQEGHSHVVLDEIVDHHSNGNAVSKDDAFFIN